MPTTEQERMIQAISAAIELENEGRECYLTAARNSANEAGRKLLQALADEEDDHRRHFQSLYQAISRGHGWPVDTLQVLSSRQIRQNLATGCREIGVKVSGTADELAMVNTAIEKEKMSHEFYREHAEKAAFQTEKEFYATLADEEWEHARALLDYAEYLTNPEDWFAEKEHLSMDGG
jgi:rubrerythrin